MITKEIKLDDKRGLVLDEESFFGKEIVVGRINNKLFFCTEEEWQRLTREMLQDLKGRELRRGKRRLFSSTYLRDVKPNGRVLIPQQLIY